MKTTFKVSFILAIGVGLLALVIAFPLQVIGICAILWLVNLIKV